MRIKQFSLRFLIGLTTCFGILFGVWKAYIYEPPTHKFPHYAKAQAVLGTTTTVGPNRISLEYAARNNRDGTPLHVEIDVSEGDRVSGSRAGGSGNNATLALRPEPQNPDQAFTLAAEVKGISELPLSFRLRDSKTGILMNESAIQARTRYRASASMNTVWGHVYLMPLNQIDAIEVSVSTVP